MPTRNVEEQLRDFLHWEEEQRRLGHTPEKLSQKIDALTIAVRRIAADRLQDRQRLDRYGRRLGRLENQVALMSTSTPAVPDWHADPAEITGTHQFAVVQRAQIEALEDRFEAEEERRRENDTWWKRTGVRMVATIIVGLVLAAAAGCAGYALKQFDQTKHAQ